MAEQENITAMEETDNPNPSNREDNDEGMLTDPTKLVQAIVANRDFTSSILTAIMNNIALQLKHVCENTPECLLINRVQLNVQTPEYLMIKRVV